MQCRQTRQGYVDALIELARENDSIIVLDADVAKATKTCGFEKVFPERFINCGIQEQNMMSVAAGLALEGFIPLRQHLECLPRAGRGTSFGIRSPIRRLMSRSGRRTAA